VRGIPKKKREKNRLKSSLYTVGKKNGKELRTTPKKKTEGGSDLRGGTLWPQRRRRGRRVLGDKTENENPVKGRERGKEKKSL